MALGGNLLGEPGGESLEDGNGRGPGPARDAIGVGEGRKEVAGLLRSEASLGKFLGEDGALMLELGLRLSSVSLEFEFAHAHHAFMDGLGDLADLGFELGNFVGETLLRGVGLDGSYVAGGLSLDVGHVAGGLSLKIGLIALLSELSLRNALADSTTTAVAKRGAAARTEELLIGGRREGAFPGAEHALKVLDIGFAFGRPENLIAEEAAAAIEEMTTDTIERATEEIAEMRGGRAVRLPGREAERGWPERGHTENPANRLNDGLGNGLHALPDRFEDAHEGSIRREIEKVNPTPYPLPREGEDENKK